MLGASSRAKCHPSSIWPSLGRTRKAKATAALPLDNTETESRKLPPLSRCSHPNPFCPFDLLSTPLSRSRSLQAPPQRGLRRLKDDALIVAQSVLLALARSQGARKHTHTQTHSHRPSLTPLSLPVLPTARRARERASEQPLHQGERVTLRRCRPVCAAATRERHIVPHRAPPLSARLALSFGLILQ